MPDRATIHVTVDGDGDSRASAYAVAAASAAAVDAVLDAEREALERVTTAALLVQPKTRWRKGEQQRTGWRAARTSVVEVADLARVGDLLAQLAAAGGSIVGPNWELDPSHAAHDEARRMAAEDARRRADAYAAALGLTIVSVAWVSEPGLRLAGGSPWGGVQAGGAMRGMAAMAQDESIDISPEELTVHAVVEVGFTIAS